MTDSKSLSQSRGRIHDLARALEKGLRQLQRNQKSTSSTTPDEARARIQNAFDVILAYERLSGEVYKLRAAHRATGSGGAELSEGEDSLSAVATDLLRLGEGEKASEPAYRTFIRSYRRIWRRHLGLFYFVVSIFLASCLLGWNIGAHKPDYVVLITGQGMMEAIHDHHAWFEGIRENSALAGAQIAWNNIRVCLMSFALGTLFGIGGLYILAFNGLSFGCIFGYCYRNDFHEQLLNFVVSHGFLELTIIVASCFAGMLVGRAYYVRPLSLMRQRLSAAATEAATVCVGIIPWLCVAATFEGFVSPYKFFSFSQKMILGLIAGASFWLWTFSPLKTASAAGSQPPPLQANRDARKTP